MRLSAHACSFVTVPDHADAAQVRDALARNEFAVVVTADGHPLAMLTAADVADESGLLQRFPSLVVVSGEPDELEPDELVELAELVGREGTRGVLVEYRGQLAGVLPRRTLAEALDLTTLQLGTPSWFVCHECTPPSYLLPRTATATPPTCRRAFFHAPMTAEP